MKRPTLMLAAAVVALSLVSIPARADDDLDEVVTVTGTGRVTRDPDIAKAHFSVETVAATAKKANQDNAKRMEKVIQALRRAGIAEADIATRNYRIYPRYEHDERGRRTPEPVGFTASNTLEVTLRDLDKVGERIDEAVEAGANRVESLVFELSDPEAARREALVEAVTQGREEARLLAETAGRKLGKAVRIQTHGAVFAPRAEHAPMLMSKAMDSATPVAPGPLQVEAQVTLSFELED